MEDQVQKVHIWRNRKEYEGQAMEKSRDPGGLCLAPGGCTGDGRTAPEMVSFRQAVKVGDRP